MTYFDRVPFRHFTDNSSLKLVFTNMIRNIGDVSVIIAHVGVITVSDSTP